MSVRVGASVVVVGMLAGCGASNPPPASWELVAHDLPSAALSVWAGSPTNVWVVGGAAGADGPLVEHYDGTTWTKFSTGLGNVNLWLVRGFADGTVLMGGSGGTIVKTTDGSVFTPMATPTTNAVVFGLWGASSTDVWAVGGSGTGTSAGFMWRYDGSAWTIFPNIPANIANGTCWKVNGLAPDDVWMSGTNGAVMHWTSTGLDSTTIPAAEQEQDSLFSIAASSHRAVTVGGSTTGVIFENDGSGWQTPFEVGVLLSGVAVSEDNAYAVGGSGAVLHSNATGGWTSDTTGLTTQNLHSAYIDPTEDVWVVGGEFSNPVTSGGVVLHKGAPLGGDFQ